MRLFQFATCALNLGTGLRAKWSIFWRLTKNFRVRLRLAPAHSNGVYSVETSYGTLHLRDNFGDVTNLVSLVAPNAYHAGRLRQPGTIVDVGANIGLAARMWSHFNPDRVIHCIEPLVGNADLIARNCSQARVHVIALGKNREPMQFNVDPHQVMASRIPCSWDTQNQLFETISLDELAEAENVEEIALLKIDTEGMEVDILQGAGKTLQRTHRVVLETHGNDNHQQILSQLRSAGFAIQEECFDGSTGMVFAEREGQPSEPEGRHSPAGLSKAACKASAR